MALTRQQKESQLSELQKKIQEAKSVIFANYIGLTVADISKLRSELKKGKAEFKVAKKTLIQLALKQLNSPEISPDALPGPVACIFSMEEPVSGAGIAFRFGKDHTQVKLIGGLFGKQVLSAAEAIEFASIPSKPQLLAIFMSMCNSPLTQFATTCSSPLSGFARALSELATKRSANPNPNPNPS
ncbi:50S ribosomal protein L10 [Candidatus Peribacteria bacterium RIFCSPLOWO2_01_FULL_51_18]|nr:MAG: 50S ribosomal protein L10 [Candidatus Peribacteria bacterium RIFCSPHIGHO2_02_FULL_51_15]OGJ66287.1 MAG: 50S ribosomal protein L10 [Candidatus Peribacteria bacterium RIFCSPLOWO2_01_FULL_51_18]OGJ68546.1 MAG: 50S ribosomal protein L10 [Candidatus Peribacteria bacterium RIFCSPLOWO2_02_FULL_51_10]